MTDFVTITVDNAPIEVAFYDENTRESQLRALQADTARAAAVVAQVAAGVARDAAVAGAASAGYRPTLAEGIADFTVGQYFTSDDQDEDTDHPNELRLYLRTVGSPFYEDAGDEASPVGREFLRQPTSAGIVGIKQGSPLSVARYVLDEARDRLSIEQILPEDELPAVRAMSSSYDAGAQLEDMLGYIVDSRKFATLEMHGGKVKCNRMLTIDTGLIQTDLSGILDFTDQDDEHAIELLSSLGTGAAVDRRPNLKGLNLIGPGFSSGQHCLLMDQGSDGISQIALSDFTVRQFSDGIVMGDHTYCVDFSNFLITQCKRGAFKKDGGSNAGERLSFHNGTFSVCGTSARSEDINANWYFNQVSHDYPSDPDDGASWLEAVKGSMEVTQCHFEGNNLTSPMGGKPPFYVGPNNTAKISIAQSRILFATPYTDTVVFENNNTEKEIDCNNVYLYQARGLNDVIATGRIRAGFHYLDGGGNHTNGVITSRSENLNFDAFEAAEPLEFYISEDGGGAITERLNGSFIDLSISAAESYSGSKSLLITKAAPLGGGSAASASCAFPIKSGSVVGAEFWLKKPGDLTGPLFANLSFARGRFNSFGRFEATNTESITSPTLVTFIGSAMDWTRFLMNRSNARAPAWATHVVLSLSLSSIDTQGASPGGIHMDDLRITGTVS